jgi:uncharacterized membrane protein YsdA (DUF1294 family)
MCIHNWPSPPALAIAFGKEAKKRAREKFLLHFRIIGMEFWLWSPNKRYNHKTGKIKIDYSTAWVFLLAMGYCRLWFRGSSFLHESLRKKKTLMFHLHLHLVFFHVRLILQLLKDWRKRSVAADSAGFSGLLIKLKNRPWRWLILSIPTFLSLFRAYLSYHEAP